MKRMLCLILLFGFILSGCSSMGERIKEPVTFYYIRENYQDDMGDVVGTEVREASGHRYDLPYLLALYSMGPSEKNLTFPFSKNTMIIPVERSEDELVLNIQNGHQTLSDIEYTLASTCLAMTCMELIEVEYVTVIWGDRNITINADNLMLTATSMQKTPEGTK